jgi:hypothetical protein
MTVYGAHNNDTPAELLVADLGVGAGRIKCYECGGDGNWGKSRGYGTTRHEMPGLQGLPP